MSATHKRLVAAAKEAIDKVHTDRTVSPETNLASLEELVEHMEPQIDGLKMTIDSGEAD